MSKGHHKVIITQYKWAGEWGPFRILSQCQECDLTTSLIKKSYEENFREKGVVLEIKPWLDNIWYCLTRGAWHAPIIMINGKFFHQYSHQIPLFDRQRLIDQVNHLLKNP